MVMKAPAAKSETRTIPAGEFKAKCLKLMDEANEKNQPITITKRGKVVGEFVPKSVQPKPFRSIFGRTPGVRLPTQTEWRKLKDEWADEWDTSTERLARQIHGDFSEDR
jgi:prevent-host-death family protein